MWPKKNKMKKINTKLRITSILIVISILSIAAFIRKIFELIMCLVHKP